MHPFTVRMGLLGLLCLTLGAASVSADYLPNDNIAIGTRLHPIEVPFEPNAPPWRKIIDDPQGLIWADDAYDFAPMPGDAGLLTAINLSEWLIVGGTTPWTDWHEEIVGAAGSGWVFDRPGRNPGLPGASGPALEVRLPGETDFALPTGYSVDPQDQTVDFYFDPLPIGTEVHIIKRLVYLGADYQFNTQPPDQWLGPLVIDQWPTVPEPATFTMALAALLLGVTARRR